MKTEQQKQAEKVVKKIDCFINTLSQKNVLWASLLFKRMAKQMNESDLEDTIIELEMDTPYRTIKIDTLVAQIEFETFKQQIETNPYQFKLAI